MRPCGRRTGAELRGRDGLPGRYQMTLFDVPTHASKRTYGAGQPVKRAAEKVKQILLNWAGEMLRSLCRANSPPRRKDFRRGETLREMGDDQGGCSKGSGERVGSRQQQCPFGQTPALPILPSALWKWRWTHRQSHVKNDPGGQGADVGTPISLSRLKGRLQIGLHGPGLCIWRTPVSTARRERR
jgi:hypothetical protein